MAIRDPQRRPAEHLDRSSSSGSESGKQLLDRLAREGRLIPAQFDLRSLGPPLSSLSGKTLSEAVAEDRSED